VAIFVLCFGKSENELRRLSGKIIFADSYKSLKCQILDLKTFAVF